MRRTASAIATWPPITFAQVGLSASSRSAMNTRAPELSALIIILVSAGPVISTRRSSRSGGAGATRQSAARMSAVSARKSGRSPAEIRAWRSARRRSSASRSGPNRRCRSARNASASGVRTRSRPGTARADDLDAGDAAAHGAGVPRRTVASMSPCGSSVATKISPRLVPPNGVEVDDPVVQVGQGHPDLVDLRRAARASPCPGSRSSAGRTRCRGRRRSRASSRARPRGWRPSRPVEPPWRQVAVTLVAMIRSPVSLSVV